MIGKLIDKPWKVIVLIIIETIIFFAALWFGVLTVLGEAIYNAITILWLLFIGSTLYLYGDVVKKPKFNTMGFAVFLFAFFLVIDRYEGYAVKFSAFAAVLVAFAAFISIEESRRLREDNRSIQAEEKRRLALERIRRWAEDTIELLTRPILTPNLDEALRDMERLIQPTVARSIGILLDTERMDRDLNAAMVEITRKLTEFLWRLRSNELIEKYISEHKYVGLKQFANEDEFLELRKELLTKLADIIKLTTGKLVPEE